MPLLLPNTALRVQINLPKKRLRGVNAYHSNTKCSILECHGINLLGNPVNEIGVLYTSDLIQEVSPESEREFSWLSKRWYERRAIIIRIAAISCQWMRSVPKP